MKKLLLKGAVLIITGLFSSSAFAQDWATMMQDPNANLFETQKAFYKYRDNYISNYKQAHGTEPAKVPGEKIFKRWEWFQLPRVSANGQRMAPDATWNAMVEYNKKYDKPMAGAWTSLGPNNVSGIYGAGRINALVVHPTNPSTLYACTPSGGLWVSTNDGSSWTTNTDKLPQVIGATDLAIDPNTPNTMYMATGDGDGGDNYSVGLLKTTDGGTTWNPTGLVFAPGNYRQMSRVLINPNSTSTIFACTTGGIFKSTDAGATFTLVLPGSFKDMEFKPGDPNTIYAVGTEFYRSTDGGLNWGGASGLPTPTNLQRCAIGVTAANSNLIMLVAMKATTYDMEGVYRSTNGGASFTKVSSPNIGNQGFYDLCIDINPSNANEVMLGGQTQFMKSTNQGSSWSNIIGSMHVDFHDITYTSGNTLYVCSDGGVWKSTNNGGSWSNKSNGLSISQKYGFGHSASSASPIIAGRQDNGTDIYNGSSWGATMGGDGMLCFVSWNSNSMMWGSQYNGSLNRSTNGGGSWGSMSGISETCPWVTEWNEDPNTAGKVYAGCANVWTATGTSFSKLPGNVGTGTVTITAISVSPASSQTMWAAKGGTLYKSTNGGSAWTAITSLPAGTITDIVSHPTDVNKAWITFSGYTNTQKVFGTTDGGTTWNNMSASLPNIPINCIEIDKNGNDALYIGTDVGCFYIDSSFSVWQPFSTGLPNVVITQLQMYYPGNLIRASSYGRGMWESTLYTPGAYPPDANFAGGPALIGCPGLGVQFYDYTAGSPTSWSWTFPGGTPSSSTQQNPYVIYNTAGTYSVTLSATNANGTDVQTFGTYVQVSTSPQGAPTIAQGSSMTICGPAPVSLSATGSGTGTLRWWDAAAGGNLLGTGASFNPTVNGTTSYYVDEAFPNGNIDFVGEFDKSVGSGTNFTFNDIRGLYFDVLAPVTINDVYVYSYTAGNRTVEILDANGNMVTDTTMYVPAAPNTQTKMSINRTLYTGNNYFIKLRGLVDCWRNDQGAAYPYTSSAVNITGSNATPTYYYFFYNWNYTTIVCNTSRDGITITDTCSLTGVNDLFLTSELVVYPNPNSGVFTVSFNVDQADDYNITLTNAIGQAVYEETLSNFSGKYEKQLDITESKKGVYLMTISNSKEQSVKKVLVH